MARKGFIMAIKSVFRGCFGTNAATAQQPVPRDMAGTLSAIDRMGASAEAIYSTDSSAPRPARSFEEALGQIARGE